MINNIGNLEGLTMNSGKEINAEIKLDTALQIHQKNSDLDEKAINSSALSFIDQLPDDVLIDHVFSHIKSDLQSMGVLSRVCKQSHALFQPDLNQEALKQLLQHIAYGEEEKAQKIIASNPSILLKRGTVKDYSGNTIEDVSPFELAYGGDDAGMCKMMLPYVDTLPQGRMEILKQVKDRFPESKEKPYDFGALLTAINTNTNLEVAMEIFRDDFKPRVIKKGKHCNPQALTDAIWIYVRNYESWTPEQADRFLCQVIGYLQRMLSASYAQALCQGFYQYCIDGTPINRDLHLLDGTFYYPADPDSRQGLGFDFAVHQYRKCTELFISWSDVISPKAWPTSIVELCQKKSLDLQTLLKIMTEPQLSKSTSEFKPAAP